MTYNKEAPVAFVAGTDRKSAMALGFSFDAFKRALSITSGNIVAHFGLWAWAFSKRHRLGEALETPPASKGIG